MTYETMATEPADTLVTASAEGKSASPTKTVTSTSEAMEARPHGTPLLDMLGRREDARREERVHGDAPAGHPTYDRATKRFLDTVPSLKPVFEALPPAQKENILRISQARTPREAAQSAADSGLSQEQADPIIRALFPDAQVDDIIAGTTFHPKEPTLNEPNPSEAATADIAELAELEEEGRELMNHRDDPDYEEELSIWESKTGKILLKTAKYAAIGGGVIIALYLLFFLAHGAKNR